MKIKIPTLFKKNFFTKRQRFTAGVIILSASLFLVEHFLSRSALYAVLLLAILTDIFLYWALHKDLKDNFSPQVFILPFLYTLAFGLFYFSLPQRLLVEIFLTILYAVGLYSAYLSQNIFTISSIRTIALLSSARTVSFVLSIFIYAFFTNTVFSSQLSFFIILPLVFTYSLLLIIHLLWTYTLEKKLRTEFLWGILLSVCLSQMSLLLWFWPSKPLVISLFLTGFFYIIVGLSHLWFEKRLFKSVLWEYIWVAVFVFIVLVVFTSWT
ncbi:MAG: hypothetical protein HYW63_02695 [Candidatus Levybacteria bacterium]|nr:hypothetical protein [Candidatus Levybacteria bacterium]